MVCLGNPRLAVAGPDAVNPPPDLTGREIETLVNESQQAGKYKVEWDASGLESGIYFGLLRRSQGRQVLKLIVIE